MGVIVEDMDSVEALNELLHEYGRFIIGRMGLPYRERGVSVISVVLDAPQDTISALAGKVGALPGVSVKTLYSNVSGGEEGEGWLARAPRAERTQVAGDGRGRHAPDATRCTLRGTRACAAAWARRAPAAVYPLPRWCRRP